MVKKAKQEQEKAEENTQDSQQEKQSVDVKGGFGRLMFRLVVLGTIAGGGYWLYANPSVWQKAAERQPAQDVVAAQIAQLQDQVATLQAQLLNLPKPDVSGFENKVENLEKQVLNVIDSKADAGIVLGILTRVDKQENRLDKLAKISDDGALILSAAMLVKQAAAEGGDFLYEAEILNQLTPENAKIKKEVSVIDEFSRNGIVSERVLIQRFGEIYAEVIAKQHDEDARDWKERINQKIGEYVKIRKAGEGAPIAAEQKAWKVLQESVSAGDLKQAIKLIESSESDDIKQNQLLQEWLADAKNYLSFNQAIRNIAAYSLAEMKVNNLKNKE